MKKTALISCVMVVGLLSACSPAASEKTETINQGEDQTKQVEKQNKTTNDLNKPVVVNGIELVVKQEETKDVKKRRSNKSFI
ncbi:hypothetical protein MFLO_09672 [Listeria floridensis FSL S10-1187]|uniref:Lipoprotein n=1 Tax=Listeria floridensis FSL S10-1187 TaxID=1265817 RepID=A0ABN0RE96_9LIST|nr:hypothetical protein [Listeria floridensis]EUJ30954.1 hypothetical protein MFLO_09672 [Listeria floridensis FSL S10-1187]